jgi:transcriptional regulator GlxA family with amidase domain
MGGSGRHHVVALVVGEVVAFDLSIPAQVFGREPSLYSWAVCAPEPGPVPAETGFDVLVPHGLDALGSADTVVVPGIGDHAWPPAPEALEALSAAARRGARVASICTGAFVLAAAGLLDGRRAATHWAYASLLAEHFPAVEVDPDVLYVDNGSVLTSAGKAAALPVPAPCPHRPRLVDRQRRRPPPGRAAAPGRRPGPVRHHPSARPGQPPAHRTVPLGDRTA